MDDTLRMRIVGLLSKDINKLYSISEISKLLGSAYSHSNSFVNELAKEKVIKIIKIANANICTLNLKENLTFGYLLLHEYSLLKEWVTHNQQKSAKINLFVSRLKEKKIAIDSVFVSKSNVFIIVQNVSAELSKDIVKEQVGLNYVVIDRSKFIENQSQFLLDRTIFYGAERFWECVKKNIKFE
jgi:hypothetical protein